LIFENKKICVMCSLSYSQIEAVLGVVRSLGMFDLFPVFRQFVLMLLELFFRTFDKFQCQMFRIISFMDYKNWWMKNSRTCVFFVCQTDFSWLWDEASNFFQQLETSNVFRSLWIVIESFYCFVSATLFSAESFKTFNSTFPATVSWLLSFIWRIMKK